MNASVPAALPRRIAAFAVLMSGEFLMSWAWNTVDVLRPFIRASLGLTLTQAGSAYSAQGIGALIGAVVIGQIADRADRRLVVGAALLGIAVMLIAGAFVTSYPQLLAQRFLLGIFLGGYFPACVGIYVGLFTKSVRGRMASFMMAVFSLAIIAQGLAARLALHHDWRLLLWGGGIAIIPFVLLVVWVVPPEAPGRLQSAPARLPAAELFAPAVRRQTLMLAALMGSNFFGYQAFGGWVTTYLKDVRHFDIATAGTMVAAQFSGNIVGSFAWGWVADRFGRKADALGFVVAATAILIYLLAPPNFILLAAAGAIYGFGLSCSVIWGPWLAELYPDHLRSTAISIFNWGRIVSFFAPLITGAMADHIGLTAPMMSACAAFMLAALIWRQLPETLSDRHTPA